MKELKMPSGYQSKSGGGDKAQPATFEGEIIRRWKDGKNRKDCQDIINLIYEAGKMSSYEFIISSLTLKQSRFQGVK